MASGAPRFRRTLPARVVEVDGYKFFQVERPSGEPFRLYEFEHAVALELDGKPLEEVARVARTRHGLELTEVQVMAFVDRLGELGLLETEPLADDVADEAAAQDTTDDGREAPARDGADRGEGSAPQAQATGDEANPPSRAHALADLAAAAGISSGATTEAGADHTGRMAGWQEAEPTALMGTGMGDLLAVSRARTGEANVYPPEGAADAGGFATQELPSRPRATQELATAALRFDEPMAGLQPLAGIEIPERPVLSLGGASSQKPSRVWLWGVIAVALAAAVGFALYRWVSPPSSAPVSVNTVVPAPAAVYRWFDAAGELRPPTAPVLTLAAGGKLIELKDVGTKFAAGDTLALTEEGKRLRKDIDHVKERLAYYQQMLEAMTAEGNRSEARQAELKVKEKQLLLDEALAAYAQVAVVATTDGAISRQIATLGEKVKPGDPVVALEAQQMRAVFRMPHDDAEQAQRLAFCRIMLDQQPVDCAFVGTDERDAVVVELPPATKAPLTTPVKLARARYEGVFAVPASALVHVGNTERLFVAAPTGRAEVRAVALADRTNDEVLVAQGLDVGDAVIVEVSPSLKPNVPIRIGRTALQ